MKAIGTALAIVLILAMTIGCGGEKTYVLEGSVTITNRCGGLDALGDLADSVTVRSSLSFDTSTSLDASQRVALDDSGKATFSLAVMTKRSRTDSTKWVNLLIETGFCPDVECSVPDSVRVFCSEQRDGVASDIPATRDTVKTTIGYTCRCPGLF